MKQVITIALTAVIGLSVGSAGTIAVQRAIGPTETVAELVVPTQAEAQDAYNVAHKSSPMAVRERQDIASLDIGQCGPDNLGPGVSCMTSVRYTVDAEPQNRLVGFAKNGGGDWVATLY